ncbi:MAG: hypothetical protein A2359_00150 [Candidatus Moranbacteria bacterium RIFOXYB1_FULL_43_19]|nr:MAG: hypothetical protein A2359_00150 [Candidatus Moranbacteria bacterium RIFOXYB1_FULL_43_19]OGI28285.1 MAG: hypothetical protein A2184_04320 [Candidatus Moranbacteria bacterium RIFOXYA1_FULL_44_7]OGI33878.1 MAG: hypothetical protein A2420_03830 [Candidatus Moranbacteria bacterium RIFOXYC1_FULL_44_13]OGI38068.1 MAG: hypothetical protein A2612_02815 [Candidatus Moranbacteria bacterium RIFOXYD1_FULL_44_12]
MSRLQKLYDKKLAQAGPSPDPLEMGVRAPKKICLPIETIGDLKRAQAQRLRRIKEKMRKYILL